MNKRVKEIRQSSHHSNNTLEKFGEPLGLKKSALSLIESGKNALTEQNIKAICREYNVNEDWLRTGEGEMLNPKDFESDLAKFTATLFTENSDSFKNRLISALTRLTEEQWEVLEKIAEEITKK